jgi:hypothetical protein
MHEFDGLEIENITGNLFSFYAEIGNKKYVGEIMVFLPWS